LIAWIPKANSNFDWKQQHQTLKKKLNQLFVIIIIIIISITVAYFDEVCG